MLFQIIQKVHAFPFRGFLKYCSIKACIVSNIDVLPELNLIWDIHY